MKKTLCIILLVLLIFVLPSCTSADIPPAVHVHEYGEWQTVKKVNCTEAGEEERFCTCGAKECRAIPPLTHSEITYDAVEGSCTKWGAAGNTYCTVCSALIRSQEFIRPVGHDFVDQKCTICGIEQIDYTDLSLYESNEGYAFFENAQNGQAMRNLYDEMKKELTDFHSSDTDAPYYTYNDELGELYLAAAFDYVKQGLTLEEAQTVYALFRKDHPAFYWMSYWLYWENETIIVTTVDEYAQASDRKEHNKILYDGIARYAHLSDGESSSYNIALAYYDAILESSSYAYGEYGTYELEQWSHSVMGDFLYGEMVCEGYAKLFQLLLNLSGIENIYVVGEANGSHCWNLVRMDDGNWYWFDPTRGDTEGEPYEYFCTTDTLLASHTPTPPGQLGLYFNYELPPRSSDKFESDSFPTLGEVFSANGCDYTLVSSDTVALAGEIEGDIPERIVYGGKVYTVAKG